MDSPTRYFEDLKRDLLTHPLISSVRLKEAHRTGYTEHRTYRVFLTQQTSSPLISFCETLSTELQTTATPTPTEKYDILVSDTFNDN